MSNNNQPWTNAERRQSENEERPPSFNPSYSGDDSELPEGDVNAPPKATKAQMGGAAVVGGLAGLILGGPLIGVAAGAGAAALATTKGGAGDAARATGDAAASLGKRVKQAEEEHQVVNKSRSAAKDFDEKHHVVDKTKSAARSVSIKAKEFDEKHHVVDKTKEATATAWNKAKEFDKKHQVMATTSKKISASAAFLSKKFGSKTTPGANGAEPPSNAGRKE